MSDINEMIRDSIEKYPDARPAELARLIADDLGREQLLELVLPLLVERINAVHRIDAAAARNKAFADNTMSENTSSGGRRSWKHGGHPFSSRTAFQRMCDQQVVVNGEPMRQGRCTRDDLLAMIEVRRTQIHGLENQIRNLERLVELLDEYQVEHVDEIPEDAYPDEAA